MNLSKLPSVVKGKSGWPWTEVPTSLPLTRDSGRSWPRITIVTPSYNQGQFLEETIRSVLLQGYPNLEYIIMDGGSADQSTAIIQRYAPWLDYWVSEPDGGQADAIHRGFGRATGEILGWLNSDDIFSPGALHAVANAWLQHTPCHFLTGDGDYVTMDRSQVFYQVRPRAYTFTDLLGFFEGQYLPQPAVFFSRAAYQRVGGVNAGLTYTMDLDLWLRLRRHYSLHHLPVCLAQLRSHGEAKTWKSNNAVHQEVESVIQQYLPLVNRFARWRIRQGIQVTQARSACQRGLEHYFSQELDAAWDSWHKAVGRHPAMLLLPLQYHLLGRLVLPPSVKRRLFENP